jgi:hypothetical protein
VLKCVDSGRLVCNVTTLRSTLYVPKSAPVNTSLQLSVPTECISAKRGAEAHAVDKQMWRYRYNGAPYAHYVLKVKEQTLGSPTSVHAMLYLEMCWCEVLFAQPLEVHSCSSPLHVAAIKLTQSSSKLFYIQFGWACAPRLTRSQADTMAVSACFQTALCDEGLASTSRSMEAI